ncbi:MAG: hypothetical protein KIT22_06605 [Verrucomicrobiae bacterium]|nr:hypothetical protein [Verrucomicrobiae bacterium]
MQDALVGQPSQRLWKTGLRQIGAWLAKPNAAHPNRADREPLPDQRIQANSFRHDVATRVRGGKGETRFRGERFDLLLLDKGTSAQLSFTI